MKLLNHKKNNEFELATIKLTPLLSRSLILLLIVLFLCRESKAQLGLDVALDDMQINAVTFYTFTITIDPGALYADVPSGSSLAITFPSDYNLEMLRSLPLPGYDANRNYACLNPVPNCSSITIAYSGSTFIFSGFFPSLILASAGINNPLTYTLNNIKNPSIKTLGKFVLTIFNGTNICGIGTGNDVNLTLRNTIPYTLSVVDSTIYASTPLTLTFTPTVRAQSFKLLFPYKWNYEDIIPTSFISTLYCSSVSHPAVICYFNGSDYIIENLGYVSAGQPFDLTLNSMNNPSSLTTIGSIFAFSYQNGSLAETVQITLPGNLFTPNILTRIRPVVTYLTGDKIKLEISFTIDKSIILDDYVTITFPTEFTIPTSNLSYSFELSNNNNPSLSYSVVNNTLTLTSFADLQNILTFKIIVTGLKRPRECKLTGTFQISTYRGLDSLMDSSSCCAVQLQRRQTLVNPNVSTDNPIRLTSGVTYFFKFTTSAVNLKTTDSIKIQFPSDYSSQINATKMVAICAGTTIDAGNTTNIKNSSTCSVQLNVLIISNFLKFDLTAPQTFTIKVIGIKNPTASPNVGFAFATLSQAGYVLEEIREIPVIIGTSQFNSFSVSSSSSITCATGVNYTFLIGNNGPISNGYSIQLVFPADYEKINYNLLACTLNGASMPCARLDSTYSGSNQTILLQVNLSITNITSIIVAGVTNPPSTKPTGYFYAAILDSTGLSVEQSPFNFSLSMVTAGSWSSFAVTASNYSAMGGTLPQTVSLLNRQIVSFYFTMVLPYSLKNGTNLLLTLYNSSYIIAVSNCTNSSVPVCSTNLTTGNIEVYFTAMTFASTVGLLLQIELHGMTVLSYQEVQVKGDLSIGAYPSLSIGFKSLPLLYAEKITAYSILQTTHILGATSDITLSITFSAQIRLRLSYLKIYVPQDFTTANHILTILNSSFASNSTTISSLTNPQTSAYTPFLFAAYDINDHIIAISSPNGGTQSFSLDCTIPCRTCSGLLCTSCYTTISWISEIYLRVSSSSCVSQCVAGEYLTNYTCLPCSTNCTTCLTYGANYTDGSATTCLSCPATYLLQGGVCYPSCQLGYYPSGSICAPCLANCRSCSNASACITCISPYVLNSTNCLTACPIRFVALTNNITNLTSCLPCTVSSCLVCPFSNTSSCTTCAAGSYLQSGLCVSNCSGLLLPNWAGQCVACQQCLTCSKMAQNCTSCIIGYFLYNYQCLTACPSGTYSSSRICISCSTNCSTCATSTICTLCTLPNALYVANVSSASCYANCPNGTIATVDTVTFSYVCSPCGGNCATCWISITFCLSCKSGFYLHNSTCVASCPAPLWTINGSCLNCSSSCRSCLPSDPYNCSLCAPNNYLFNNSCISSCPVGFYANSLLLACSSCSILCATCQNSSNCTSCIGGYWLYLAMCYNSCATIDPLLYSYNGSCLYCQPQCTSCLTTPFECTSCNSSYYFYQPTLHTCTLSCIPPYYANGSTCVACAYPCLTCDTKFNSCLSCNTTITSLSLLNGTCIANCPSGYYSSSSVCLICPANCSTCDSSRCLTCLPYAYVYHSRCVLNCSEFSDLPLTIDNYCSSCSQVPYCQACSTSVTQDFVCFMCVYPYVVFDGNCLNSCPQYYEANPTSNICEQSTAYSAAMLALYEYNKPLLPPFAFIGIFLLIAALLYQRSGKIYRFTYHCGYMIALITLIDTAFLMYGVDYLLTRYTGDYSGNQQKLPLFILATSFGLKLLLINALFFCIILAAYWKDIRYAQWWASNRYNSTTLSILVGIFGCRMHKLYYSKLFGKSIFSFRVISVQKFYAEDVLNWAVCLIDLLDLSAFAVVAYNIFITYSVLYISFYELAAIKMIAWGLIAYDMRKPDRGFFSGDQEEAERQILQEMKEKEAKKRKFQMENLAKLIRRKSAAELHTDKLYEFLFFDDFRSVYDPKDYEQVPVVPNRRIEKGINKGKFRRGKRITIEQKLRRFAESIKPAPIVAKDDSYLNGLIYWKPPKRLGVRKKQEPQSQESMMKLLEDKQLYYKDQLADIHIMDLDEESGIEYDSRMRRRRHGEKTIIADFDDKTNPNDTFDHFYDPSSQEMIEPEEDDFNGLMNRNYARRQHLPTSQLTNKFDEQQLRVLYHQPLKKRKPKSRLNEISIRRF